MKIGVMGTFIRDRIFPWQGEETNSIGGIFFTVSYLANLVAESAEIYPVCFLGEDFYDEVTEQLSGYKNLRLDGMHQLPRKNTQVQLHYTGPQERDEITTQPMPALTFEQLRIVADADAVIVNLITGSDVELAALEKFRKASNTLIYLDFHSHALGISDEGKRYYKRPDDWRDWINLVDVLQLNEMEARTLAGYGKDAPESILDGFGKTVLGLAPSVCHVTLADKGSYLYFTKDGEFEMQRFPAFVIPEVVDIIGCGDAFAAGYLTKYLKNGDEIAATRFANKVAALNCTFLGSSKIPEIRNLIREYD